MNLQVDDQITQHLVKHKAAYSHGVLNPKHHQRLVEDIDHFSMVAGIHPNFVTRSAKEWCSPEIIDWVKNMHKLRANGSSGLCLVGAEGKAIDQCSALTGCLLRNYLDARVVWLSDIIDKRAPACTIALCPDFYIGRDMGKGVRKSDIAAWHVPVIRDWLAQRGGRQQTTVVYVNDMDGMKRDYGESVEALIKNHFVKLGN